MSKKEKEEFSNLKHVRAERGFWTPAEQERWNHLHHLQGNEFTKKIKILEEKRLMMLN